MKIFKVINNNVASILDENNQEVIVMGKGIAFKKKIGEKLDESLIEKKFILGSENLSRLKELVEDIPVEYFKITSDIVELTKISINKKFNDSLYFSLADHIHTTVDRLKEGIPLKNPMLWEIKRYYQSEFEIALKATEMISERFNIELPEDEAGFITLHIVNAEMDDTSLQDVHEITKIIHDILNIVKYFFKITYDTKSVYYYRFVTHVRFFAQRVVVNKMHSDLDDDSLYEIVKEKYVNANKCVEKIADYILNNFNYKISNEEKLYLMIHIERIVYKVNK